MREHTRNQRRMYRIHKQDEKILEQELLISSLQNQLQQKENIIKEVREFVERYLKLNLEAFDTKCLLEKILEILDKGE